MLVSRASAGGCLDMANGARRQKRISRTPLRTRTRQLLISSRSGENMPKPRVRKGMPSVQLSKEEFARRARERFYDPSFTEASSEINTIIEVAWKNYSEYHKSPRTRPAGRGFSDPDFRSRSNGLKREKPFRRQKNVRKTRNQIPVFFSSMARLAAIKPVQARCRKRFAW
jgi:hypothetical protein